ncbi:hypothetical protein [Streptomyces sp. NPDC060027]|uniref:hypothetical protein n=1 Tax=Streptomyces sp. NPDC060027 TaxID=3347040 RepID=UPI0036C91F8F
MEVLAAGGVQILSFAAHCGTGGGHSYRQMPGSPDRKLETAMLTHALERGVLILTLDDDPSPKGRDVLATYISDLVHVHAPTPVVIVLGGEATATVISAVLRAHRLCSELGVLMSVATLSAAVRRSLETQTAADGPRLVIHARADIAIATAFTVAA